MYHVTFSSGPFPGRDNKLRGFYLGNGALFTSLDGHSWQPVRIDAPAGLSGWTVTPSQPWINGRDGVLPVAYRDPSGPDNATPNRIYPYVTHDAGAPWAQPRNTRRCFAPV